VRCCSAGCSPRSCCTRCGSWRGGHTQQLARQRLGCTGGWGSADHALCPACYAPGVVVHQGLAWPCALRDAIHQLAGNSPSPSQLHWSTSSSVATLPPLEPPSPTPHLEMCRARRDLRAAVALLGMTAVKDSSLFNERRVQQLLQFGFDERCLDALTTRHACMALQQLGAAFKSGSAAAH
jgi:hypothetical protein